LTVVHEDIVTKAVKLSDIEIKDKNQTLRPLTQLEREHLKHSISKFGVKVPIDINDKYEVVDGHHRTELSIELGLEYIPALIHDFSDITEKEFIYAANVPRRHLNDFEIGEYGYPILLEEREKAAARQTLGSNDPKVTTGTATQFTAKRIGVSEPTLKRCVKIIEKSSEEVKQRLRSGKARIGKEYNNLQKQEKRQQLLEEARINKRELPQGFKLINADFREVTAEQIPDNSIDCIFTDPPYNIESLPLYEGLASLAMRVLKPGGSLITITGGYELLRVGNLFESAGLRFNWVCYMKHAGPTLAMHGNHVVVCGKRLLWFHKGDKLTDTGKYVTDFIESEAPNKSLHDWAQSPIEAEHFISRLTVENQIVLDPFMGSATTGIACLNLNRQFIGIEIDHESFETANANLERASQSEKEKSK
jgi:site-specific DNA-methyltransferase (adenine-specific)